MGKIICLMGKSASGKDTVYKRLLADRELGLKHIVPYTTRPIREGERNGGEYYFTEESAFWELKRQGRIIEDRAYHTCHGLWRYFTVNDSQFREEGQNYILIGTLEAYEKLKDYFGTGRLLPIMIVLDDGIRLQRALDREKKQAVPRYEEMCRRFLADSEDFSEKKMAQAGISRCFENRDLDKCLEDIRCYMKKEIRSLE